MPGYEPAGPITIVSSGVVAGRPWTYQLYRGKDGGVCLYERERGGGSCIHPTPSSPDFSLGINPYYNETGTKGLGTEVNGWMPAAAKRVRVELRGHGAVELGTVGGDSMGVAAFATVLPGLAVDSRVTVSDAPGEGPFHEQHPP